MPPSDFDSLAGSARDVIKSCMGIEATYTKKAGGSLKITGIFRDGFTAVDPDTEQVVSSNQVIFDIKLADLKGAKPAKGDKLKINGNDWRVVDSQEDGILGAKLLLHKVGC